MPDRRHGRGTKQPLLENVIVAVQGEEIELVREVLCIVAFQAATDRVHDATVVTKVPDVPMNDAIAVGGANRIPVGVHLPPATHQPAIMEPPVSTSFAVAVTPAVALMGAPAWPSQD